MLRKRYPTPAVDSPRDTIIFHIGTVAYAAVPITARITSIAARHIISNIGSYYAVPRFPWLP